MDPIQWISTATTLAEMIRAWLDARRVGLELNEAKERTKDAARQSGNLITQEERDFANELVIEPKLLQALVADIDRACRRFAAVFDDPRYTPAQIDQEQAIARATVCEHLARVREFNSGSLPSQRLEQMWVSYQCK